MNEKLEQAKNEIAKRHLTKDWEDYRFTTKEAMNTTSAKCLLFFC